MKEKGRIGPTNNHATVVIEKVQCVNIKRMSSLTRREVERLTKDKKPSRVQLLTERNLNVRVSECSKSK